MKKLLLFGVLLSACSSVKSEPLTGNMMIYEYDGNRITAVHYVNTDKGDIVDDTLDGISFSRSSGERRFIPNSRCNIVWSNNGKDSRQKEQSN